jgi:hypothetical protein
MTISTPRRRLGLVAAVAMAGGLAVAGMPAASADTNGNLETKGALYYCEGGNPQMVVYARTTTTTDTISYTSKHGNGSWPNLQPQKSYGQVYSSGDSWAGVKDTLSFVTKTTGDKLAVSINIPTSCAGLPNGKPASGWQGEAQAPGPAPSSPSSSDPSSSSSSSSSATSSTSTEEPSGPPVDTGVVSDGANGSTLALIGLLSTGVVVAGGAATRRLKR